MANPNPARITNPLWRVWEESSRIIPGVRLGGIYADKNGYHDTRNSNPPGDYSVVLTLDKQGPGDKAAAIDLTMSDGQMRLRTGYLKTACFHPDDDRVNGMREFYGTLDSRTVYGLIQNQPGGPWQQSYSDSSHLWHIHISIFRAFVDRWDMLEPLVSVLSGETWEAWKARKGTATPPPSGGTVADTANSRQWAPYGQPDAVGQRTIATMIDDLWGHLVYGTSPYDGAVSPMTQRSNHMVALLEAIKQKVDTLETPSVTLPEDAIRQIKEGLADDVAGRVLQKIAAVWNNQQ